MFYDKLADSQHRYQAEVLLMDATLTAIELTGTIDKNHQLQLDSPLSIDGPVRVRVIVLYPQADELTEAAWLHAAARNPAFAELHAPEEDIYSLADGRPFHDPV